MTNIGAISSLVTLALFAIYAIYILIRHFKLRKTSLVNIEAIHRFFLISGGLLLGLGLSGYQSRASEYEFNTSLLDDRLYIGILFVLLGLLLILLGSVFMRSQLWSPLEQISEYSANFGEDFIATRLPITGGIELQAFSERFNENARSLADKISVIEINVDRLTDSINSTIDTGTEMSETIRGLSDLAINYSDFTAEQEGIVSEIGSEISEFVDWYDTTQQQLQQNFVDLRSLSEMGNLIAVNAAIEAANLDEPNPGIETLASRLRELGRSLEEIQGNMRRLLDEVELKYDDFKRNIENTVNQAVEISEKTVDLSSEVDDVIRSVGEKEVSFSDEANNLRRELERFTSDLPNAY